MTGWVNQTHKNTMYVFYPGRGNNQTGVARFLGAQPFYTTTGEVSYSKRSILAMPYHKIWLYPEIDEINKTPRWAGIFGLLQLRKRGIVVGSGRLNYQAPYPINEKGSVRWYSVYSKKISMGQESDTCDHKRRVDALMDTGLGHDLPDNIVLYGPSRGAVTSFVALAKHKNNYKNIKLCVLEAPFGTYTSIAKYFLGWIGKWLYRWGILNFIFGSKHKPLALPPKAYVDDFPDDVPLVVVASTQDNVIPFKSSLNLALAVAAKRIKKIAELGEVEAQRQNIMPVYFIQLDKSNHSLALGDANDRLRYQQYLHAIYKKHDLPYIKEYAEACAEDLSQIELTRGPLRSQIMWHDTFKKTHDGRENIQKNALSELKLMHDSRQGNDDRLLEICKYMAPYRKSSRRFYFFGEPVLQHEISQLQSSIKLSC